MPDPPAPPLTGAQLAALIRVADTGSFSEAALQLGLAQSSVSQAVKSAEALLGARLFERGRLGARLTPAGERVLVPARHAALALRAMVSAAQDTLSGTLHLASCRSVIRTFVTPALNAFRAEYPGVQVVVHDHTGEHDDIERMVCAGGAHLGLGRLPMRPELSARPLLADEYLIVQAAHAAPIQSWEELHRAAYIVCEEDCAPHVAAHIAAHSRSPAAAVRLRDVPVALGMVAEGHGFAVLTGLVVHPLPPGLQTSPLPAPLWRTIGLVSTREQAVNPLVEAFSRSALSPAAVRARGMGLGPLLRFPDTD